jgi:hypothetical protein
MKTFKVFMEDANTQFRLDYLYSLVEEANKLPLKNISDLWDDRPNKNSIIDFLERSIYFYKSDDNFRILLDDNMIDGDVVTIYNIWNSPRSPIRNYLIVH